MCACAGSVSGQQHESDGEELRDADALARRVLSEELTKGTLPDINLLPESGRVFVRSPVRGARLSARAFGPVGKRSLRAATLEELQELADRQDRTVVFIEIEIEIAGDTAHVDSGVDIVLPATSDAMKTCCCSRSTTWRKVRGRWERDHSAPVRTICS